MSRDPSNLNGLKHSNMDSENGWRTLNKDTVIIRYPDLEYHSEYTTLEADAAEEQRFVIFVCFPTYFYRIVFFCIIL